MSCYRDAISIPDGSIKSDIGVIDDRVLYRFQFQMVRLKVLFPFLTQAVMYEFQFQMVRLKAQNLNLLTTNLRHFNSRGFD